MKKYFFILFVLPAILFSCQKEAVEIDDVLANLELKSNDGKEADRKGNACFDIQFPLTIIMPDDSEITANSRKDLAVAVKQWFTDNGKEYKQKIVFKYPVTVVFKGKTLTIESERGLKRIKMACRGKKDVDKDKVVCLKLVYPVSYTMPDRTILTIKNRKDHAKAMKNWFEEHPDVERQRPAIQYPVNVNFKGRPLTLENEREMARIRKACAGDKEGDKDKKLCFQMVYPLSYTMPDKTTIEVSSKDEAVKVFKRWYEANPRMRDQKPGLQFPIKIKYLTDDKRGKGKIVKIENQEALKIAYAACGK